MKAKSLSPRILTNVVVGKWAKFCQKNEDFKWTKADQNVVDVILRHVKDRHHDRYEKNKYAK